MSYFEKSYKPETENSLAIEVQTNMHFFFYLL